MNDNRIYELLIDYAEGNISSEQKMEIELLLQHSSEAQRDLQLIQSALDGLNSVSDEDVPSNYFPNILPRLRERLDSQNFSFPIFIPEWFRLASVPSAVSIIIFSIAMLYQSFKPEELRSPLYSMINDMERTEIGMLADDTADFGPTSGIINNVESVIGDISNSSIIESKLAEDLRVLDVSAYQSDHELLSDLGDKELEQVIDRLDKTDVR